MTRVAALLNRVARTLRVVIGVPDYERYVDHCRAKHLGMPPMTRDEFAADRLERKYSRPGTRCC
jgi:uncharacterized short protein YbdD (DUF466 family)